LARSCVPDRSRLSAAKRSTSSNSRANALRHHEEAATYRGWRRAVVAIYCSVLLLGGMALLVSMPVAHQEMAQVTPPVNVP
jgi:hypothetical protein